MDNQIFDLHLVEAFNLARSLIIKNEQTAVAINNELLLKNSNYIISEDSDGTEYYKETWKYYQNLAGEYHETDIVTIKDYNYKNGFKLQKFNVHEIASSEHVSKQIVIPDFIMYDTGISIGYNDGENFSIIDYLNPSIKNISQEFNASAGLFPNATEINAGDTWVVSVPGTINGRTVSIGDKITAIVNNPAPAPDDWNSFDGLRQWDINVNSEFKVISKNSKTNISIIEIDDAAWTTKFVLPGTYYLWLSYPTNNGKMIVKSIDTLENIEFTKEELVIHKATKRAYNVGTNYYNELVRNYPFFELLIQCIITPIPYYDTVTQKGSIAEEKIIDTLNNTCYIVNETRDNLILSYNKELVEPNEGYLLIELQKTLDNLKFRWTVPGYFLLDELYSTAQDAIIYIHLTSIIEGIRLTKCKTFEVHSWHIKQYLASHNGLDIYFDKLTREQALFLYRNIRYIQRHAGKEDTFDKLIENMMRKRGIPLKEWNMKHDTTDIASNLLPETLMSSKDIVVTGNSFGAPEQSVEDIMLKQIPKAMHNEEVFDESLQKVTFFNDTGKDSFLKTKTLESAMVDYEDTEPFKLTEVLYNHWIYLSSKLDEFGRPLYRSSITVKHPVTGDEFTLRVREAYLLYFYAANQATGMTLENKLFVITPTDITNGWVELDYRVKDGSVEIANLVLNVDYTVEYESVNGVTRINFLGTLIEDTRYFVKYYYNGGFIPQMKANRVRRIELPTTQDLKNLVDGSINVKVYDKNAPGPLYKFDMLGNKIFPSVPKEHNLGYASQVPIPAIFEAPLKTNYDKYRQWDDVYPERILEDLVEIDFSGYASIDVFYDLCKTIHAQRLNHYRLYSVAEDSRIRGYIEVMADAIYMDQMMTMTNIDPDTNLPIDNYETWFAEQNLSIPFMSSMDWAKFAADIFNRATGIEFFQKSTARSIQAAMVAIVEKLSSYNIQIIASMLDNIYDGSGIVLRLDEDMDTSSTRGFQWDPTLQIVDMDTSSSASAELDEHHAGADLEVTQEGFNLLDYVLPVEIKPQFDVEDMEDIPIMLNADIIDFEVEELIFP